MDTFRQRAEKSGEWLIQQVKAEAMATGFPFEEWDEWVLRNTFEDFSEEDVPHVVMTLNDSVHLIRSAITKAKKNGAATIKVRPGLVLPTIWQGHYELVYTSELPWMISVAMQNAFFGNPLEDEEGPWNPDRGLSAGAKSAIKWGTVGAVIASLLGG